MRSLARALVLAAACLSSGCLVAALQPFYTDATLQTDDGLPGTWQSDELGAKVVVERGEWKAYRLTYTARNVTLALTGYLTKLGDVTLLDVTPAHGADPGPLVIAVHGACRLDRAGDRLTVSPLAYDYFAAAQRARTLGKLDAVVDARQNVILTAPAEAVRAWLLSRPADGGQYGEPIAFLRKTP